MEKSGRWGDSFTTVIALLNTAATRSDEDSFVQQLPSRKPKLNRVLQNSVYPLSHFYGLLVKASESGGPGV